MTPEDTVAVDTVTATLRHMAHTADVIAVALRVAIEIRADDADPEWRDRGTELVVRAGSRLADDLATLFRQFPPLP